MTQSESMLFDSLLLRQRRNRAAARRDDSDFLFREVADRLLDRVQDVARRFDWALDIGARDGTVGAGLMAMGKVDRVIALDPSPGFAMRAAQAGQFALAGDWEALPFADGKVDLVTSNLALHWANDLPGALVQANRALKPDGLFQAAILGGETLWELRDCLMAAELEETGGVSPRISPMVDLRDAAGLLQRAGFALPVADLDRITVRYADLFRLMGDLRAMGEANAVLSRLKRPTGRRVFLRAAQIYADRHADAEGRIPATFDIIHLHGWRPAESQPKPLRPGTASSSLADVLTSDEH